MRDVINAVGVSEAATYKNDSSYLSEAPNFYPYDKNEICNDVLTCTRTPCAKYKVIVRARTSVVNDAASTNWFTA